MVAKKANTKSAPSRPRRAGAARRTNPARPAVPEPAPREPRPEAPQTSAFPVGGILVALVLVAVLAVWCWHRSQPASAPGSEASSAPAPAPTVMPAVVRTPMAEARPARRHHHARPDSGALTLKAGKSITLRCWRPAQGTAELEVFGSHNTPVRSVLSGPGAEGWLNLSWNGLDDQGTRVPGGLYYARPSQKDDQVILEIRVKN